MTRATALAARLLLEASGLAGAAGPRLAAATARVADALTAAAEWAAPVLPCPGCGAAVPSLDLEVVGVCGPCGEREAVGPTPRASAAHPDARINVTPWAMAARTRRTEEPS